MSNVLYCPDTLITIRQEGIRGLCYPCQSRDRGHMEHHWLMREFQPAPKKAFLFSRSPIQPEAAPVDADQDPLAVLEWAWRELGLAWDDKILHWQANAVAYETIWSTNPDDYRAPLPPATHAARGASSPSEVRPFEMDGGEVYLYSPDEEETSGHAYRPLDTDEEVASVWREYWVLKGNYCSVGSLTGRESPRFASQEVRGVGSGDTAPDTATFLRQQAQAVNDHAQARLVSVALRSYGPIGVLASGDARAAGCE